MRSLLKNPDIIQDLKNIGIEFESHKAVSIEDAILILICFYLPKLRKWSARYHVIYNDQSAIGYEVLPSSTFPQNF